MAQHSGQTVASDRLARHLLGAALPPGIRPPCLRSMEIVDHGGATFYYWPQKRYLEIRPLSNNWDRAIWNITGLDYQMGPVMDEHKALSRAIERLLRRLKAEELRANAVQALDLDCKDVIKDHERFGRYVRLLEHRYGTCDYKKITVEQAAFWQKAVRRYVRNEDPMLRLLQKSFSAKGAK